MNWEENRYGKLFYTVSVNYESFAQFGIIKELNMIGDVVKSFTFELIVPNEEYEEMREALAYFNNVFKDDFIIRGKTMVMNQDTSKCIFRLTYKEL